MIMGNICAYQFAVDFIAASCSGDSSSACVVYQLNGFQLRKQTFVLKPGSGRYTGWRGSSKPKGLSRANAVVRTKWHSLKKAFAELER